MTRRETALLILGVAVGIGGGLLLAKGLSRETEAECVLNHLRSGMSREESAYVVQACEAKHAGEPR